MPAPWLGSAWARAIAVAPVKRADLEHAACTHRPHQRLEEPHLLDAARHRGKGVTFWVWVSSAETAADGPIVYVSADRSASDETGDCISETLTLRSSRPAVTNASGGCVFRPVVIRSVSYRLA